ncbi:MAG: hypothetical protein ACLTL5_10775 [Oscillospiraceae bacterium]
MENGLHLRAAPEAELERHNRKRHPNYIRAKHRRSDFELSVIGSFEMFRDEAAEAAEGMGRLWQEEPAELEAAELAAGNSRERPFICAMEIWISTTSLWEGIIQPSLSITGCTLASRRKICTA